MANAPQAHIISLVTATPDHSISQQEVINRIGQSMGGEMPRHLQSIYNNSGIDTRYLAQPADDYMAPAKWPQRNATYLEKADILIRDLSAQALAKAAMSAADIDIIICVSSTGVATPSLPTQILHKSGFAASTQIIPLFGYGCAGGVLGMQVARDMAIARPSANILLLCVELCSLAFRMGDNSKKGIVSTALFADGGSAMVISATGKGPHIGDIAQKTWPDTRNMMGWDIDEAGLGLILARDIPSFVTREFAPVIDDFLSANNLTKSQLREPACHPGGAKVIDALESYFDHLPDGLPVTRQILRGHGNMSSPTVHFVLKQIMQSDDDRPIIMTALGPGFTGAIGLVYP